MTRRRSSCREHAWQRSLALGAALVLAALLAGTPGLAPAEPPPAQETWMSVLLDGRKVGHAHALRELRDGAVETAQTVVLSLERDGAPLRIETRETDVERTDGTPLRFSAMTLASGLESHVEGVRRGDGRFDLTTTVGGTERETIIARPPGAMLAEGQRQALETALAAGLESVHTVLWDVSSALAIETENRFSPPEDVALPEGSERLRPMLQRSRVGARETHARMWINARGEPRRMLLPMLGMELELVACSRACALAPDQGLDILARTLVPLPAAPPAAADGGALEWRLSAADAAPLHFPETDEQAASRAADGSVQVRVTTAARRRLAPPRAEDLRANDWLQADDPQLRRLAQQATTGSADATARMHALEAFVADYVHTKTLDVGYASALEVMHERRGDCTEHAVLLAALARAQGIPARVATGLVYAPAWAGREHALVPHAWVLAWVDGHWRSFDAALGGFDATHIALDSGDGSPWHFFNAVQSLGRIRVDAVSAAQ